MGIGLIVPFHFGYYKPNDHYRVFGAAWFAGYAKWSHLVDTLYVIDHGWGFRSVDLPSKVILIPGGNSHWENITSVIPRVSEEIIGIMDCDMLTYSMQTMDNIIKKARQNDIVSIMDASGGVRLSKKYPQLMPNKFRAERRRLAPYLCFVNAKLMKATSRDFAPYNNGGDDWMDSFGKWTDEMLAQKPRVYELPDDRSTLQLHRNGKMSRDTLLDGQGFEWSEPVDSPQNRGYYHIRNFTLGLKMVNAFHSDRPTYDKYKAETPFEEAMRELAWLTILTDKYDSRYAPRIKPVIEDWKVVGWNDYLSEFQQYHKWIKSL